MDALLQDVRFALRTLHKHRSTTIVAIVCLALGIGANTAIFSVVRAVLLDALPYREPSRLLAMYETFLAQGKRSEGSVSPLDYYDFRSQNHVFEDLAAYTGDARDLGDVADPERLLGVRATANLFSVLGAAPLLGRTFAPGEDQPGAAHVVVLGEGLWRRRFAGDPRILGRSILLSGTPYTVIGVMPSSFDFPIRNPHNDFWMPLVFLERELSSRGSHWLQTVGRLKPGLDSARATADLVPIADRLARDYPEDQKDRGIKVSPMTTVVVGRVRPALLMLLGAVGAVLLIACVNVANLLLARAAARRREVALRTALGAERGRLVRQFLTESIVLSLGGGALGVVVGRWGLSAIVSLAATSLPRADAVRVDGLVLLFVMLLSMVTGVAFGVIPALRTADTDLREDLAESTSRGGSGRRHHRTLNVLVSTEIALSVVLLVGAGLLVRGFIELIDTDLGFKPERVVTFRVSAPPSLADSARYESFYRPVLERLRVMPGVRSAGIINMLPIQSSGMNGYFDILGRPVETESSRRPFAEFRVVSNDYFRTLGIPVLAGREFDARDAAASAPMLLVNEEFAKRYFPNESPLGKQIKPWSNTPATIVGVVGSARQRSVDRPPISEIYVSAAQRFENLGTMNFVVATAGREDALMRAARDVVHSVAPQQPVYQLQPMTAVVSGSLRPQRLTFVLLASLAGLAVLLSAAGVYGVMSYGVTQRTREIGIRMAIGAQRHSVVTMVMREAGRVAVVGILIGLFAASMLTKLLESMLFGVSARDPLTFGAVAILVSVIAGTASLVPALRASRVDPLLAIRAE